MKIQFRCNDQFQSKIKQVIDFNIYNHNCFKVSLTSTLLIHTLKYLASVKYCFTKEKNEGRV